LGDAQRIGGIFSLMAQSIIDSWRKLYPIEMGSKSCVEKLRSGAWQSCAPKPTFANVTAIG